MTDPWADPATPTQPTAPYAGPPPTVPVAQPPYWNPQPYSYPPAGYGYPGPWVPGPPPAPRRPGQVITVSVLSFVQAAMVVIGSLYVWMLTSLAGVAGSRLVSARLDALVTEGTVLAIVQLVSAVVLVLAGVFALTRSSRAAWLIVLGANLAQVVLALYWAIRLQVVLSDVPGPSPGGALSAFALFFAAAPVVALGLVVLGPGRRWFDGTARP